MTKELPARADSQLTIADLKAMPFGHLIEGASNVLASQPKLETPARDSSSRGFQFAVMPYFVRPASRSSACFCAVSSASLAVFLPAMASLI